MHNAGWVTVIKATTHARISCATPLGGLKVLPTGLHTHTHAQTPNYAQSQRETHTLTLAHAHAHAHTHMHSLTHTHPNCTHNAYANGNLITCIFFSILFSFSQAKERELVESQQQLRQQVS